MAYDSNKDVLLLEIEQEHTAEDKSWLVGRAIAYDGAEPRYVIIRVGKKKTGELWFRDAGRMDQAEAAWALSALRALLPDAMTRIFV